MPTTLAPEPPRVVAVADGSPADRAGVAVGDELVAIEGTLPRDVIEYHQLVDGADLDLVVARGGVERPVAVAKRAGEPLGLDVASALFDQVRTCDNHCAFCFIYQLPPGLRESLYLKDDDYRLSFLYGNYTTLTRFTEADLERIVSERLSPVNVSIHATDPDVRAAMLRNRRGATSLRWLRALLDNDIEVHGQVVVCPGINDGDVLDDTLTGVLDRFPGLATVCVVPLGVSRYNDEPDMRPHTTAEAEAVLDLVGEWQERFLAVLGRRVVFAADEYHLLADRPFPDPAAYEGFAMHEDGIGMARTFEAEFAGRADRATGVAPGFFAWVDGAPAEGYRAPRQPGHEGDGSAPLHIGPRRDAPVTVLTGHYGAAVMRPLIDGHEREDLEVLEVENRYFGGNIGVTGLLVGEDLDRALSRAPAGRRYLLPDVCLSGGRFLDGGSPDDLPRPVEVVRTDGMALRAALSERPRLGAG